MVHEVSEKSLFFKELFSILKPGKKTLIVEPPFHVSESAFQRTLLAATEVGFTIGPGPKKLFQKTATLIKASPVPVKEQEGVGEPNVSE